MSDLNNFAKDLQNPLETALIKMKNKIPSTSKECNDLLNLLLQQQKKNDAENVNSKTLPQNTTPSTQASPQNLPPPVKNEKNDDDSSGSGSYWSFEEVKDNDNEVNNVVPT